MTLSFFASFMSASEMDFLLRILSTGACSESKALFVDGRQKKGQYRWQYMPTFRGLTRLTRTPYSPTIPLTWSWRRIYPQPSLSSDPAEDSVGKIPARQPGTRWSLAGRRTWQSQLKNHYSTRVCT
jgi:hypothetical protein